MASARVLLAAAGPALRVGRPIIARVSRKPFASSADLAEKAATLEQLADGVYAYTAQGDPNVGCIIGPDSILAIEARATPLMAQRWIDVVHSLRAAPFGDLVLTHYHAVRVLGASAFAANRIIATTMTGALIEERGLEDWASEQGRMPRLFEGADTIPGLTRPTHTFEDQILLDVGGRRVELRFLGRGHTSGDRSCGSPRNGSSSPATWSRRKPPLTWGTRTSPIGPAQRWMRSERSAPTSSLAVGV